MSRAGSVLVTGCSSGLGRATATHLRQRGFRVFATARGEQDLRELSAAGFEAVALDLDHSASVRAAAERVLERSEGRLQGVVNNAGIEMLGALEDLEREDLRRCFETNVFGTLELTSLLIPAFRKQASGRIIFISSSNSNGFGYPFLGPGNASKCALEVLATTLKRELRGSGIEVSTICPGELPTSLLANMVRGAERVLSKPSPHARHYERLKQVFLRADPSGPTPALDAVVRAVAELLETRRPARRLVLPLNAKLHYLAHAALPESIQDRLLFRRMKEVFGIHG